MFFSMAEENGVESIESLFDLMKDDAMLKRLTGPNGRVFASSGIGVNNNTWIHMAVGRFNRGERRLFNKYDSETDLPLVAGPSIDAVTTALEVKRDYGRVLELDPAAKKIMAVYDLAKVQVYPTLGQSESL